MLSGWGRRLKYAFWVLYLWVFFLIRSDCYSNCKVQAASCRDMKEKLRICFLTCCLVATVLTEWVRDSIAFCMSLSLDDTPAESPTSLLSTLPLWFTKLLSRKDQTTVPKASTTSTSTVLLGSVILHIYGWVFLYELYLLKINEYNWIRSYNHGWWTADER